MVLAIRICPSVASSANDYTAAGSVNAQTSTTDDTAAGGITSAAGASVSHIK